MRPFAFVSPRTLDEAVRAMAGAGGNARALAGGSDLVDQMRVGRRTPSLVVDIKNIPDMQRLEYIPGDGLHIGAGVSCTRTGEYAPVAEHYPSIKEVCGLIGSTQIQNRASIAGNVCNSAPSGDTIPPLITYDARCIVVGPNGQREVPIGDFFAGPGQNVMAADELLLEIHVPPPPANSSGRYLRFIPREEMDIAVAGAASYGGCGPRLQALHHGPHLPGIGSPDSRQGAGCRGCPGGAGAERRGGEGRLGPDAERHQPHFRRSRFR